MNPQGKSANEILENKVVDISTWHFFQARSWLDHAKRISTPSSIHYCAFELRYGIEYLFYELLVLSSESMDESKYQKCLGTPKETKKMLNQHGSNHQKLAEFTEVLFSLGQPCLKIRLWDLNELHKIWGIASSYLHFAGTHDQTYFTAKWLSDSISELDANLESLWRKLEPTIGHGILKPSKMEPEVRNAWNDFSKGNLSTEDLKIRMRLLSPTLKDRAIIRFLGPSS